MKLNHTLTIFLTASLYFSVFVSNAQQLNLNQLEKLRLMDDKQINDYLLARNWVSQGKLPTRPTLRGGTGWGFKDSKSYGGYSSFLLASVSSDNGQRNITYMTSEKLSYDTLKKQIIEKGLIKRPTNGQSTESRQSICSEITYSGPNYWINVSACSNERFKNSPIVYKATIQ